jgi:hypothetical protein
MSRCADIGSPSTVCQPVKGDCHVTDRRGTLHHLPRRRSRRRPVVRARFRRRGRQSVLRESARTTCAPRGGLRQRRRVATFAAAGVVVRRTQYHGRRGRGRGARRDRVRRAWRIAAGRRARGRRRLDYRRADRRAVGSRRAGRHAWASRDRASRNARLGRAARGSRVARQPGARGRIAARLRRRGYRTRVRPLAAADIGPTSIRPGRRRPTARRARSTCDARAASAPTDGPPREAPDTASIGTSATSGPTRVCEGRARPAAHRSMRPHRRCRRNRRPGRR